jgi:hypothetical protein
MELGADRSLSDGYQGEERYIEAKGIRKQGRKGKGKGEKGRRWSGRLTHREDKRERERERCVLWLNPPLSLPIFPKISKPNTTPPLPPMAIYTLPPLFDPTTPCAAPIEGVFSPYAASLRRFLRFQVLSTVRVRETS